MLCNIIKTESGAGMENKENTIEKIDKVTETLIKELEGLSEEGLHEFFMFVYKMNHALPTVKQSTYISYESYVRLHLEPELGTTKLTTLTIEQLQRFFNQKKQSLSPKSLRNIYNMLHKSVTAQRTIPLFSQVWTDLMTYYKKQQALLQAQGIAVTLTTPIFSTPLGLVYEPRTYEDLFKRTLKEAGVSDINFHALRHTFATRALEAGMDIKVLSSILGHAQASTTLNLYAHALPDHKRQSMDKMGSFYGSSLGNIGQGALH